MTSHSGQFSIRTMRREDVEIAVQWAAAEGWNPGLNDAEAFFAADPDGFKIALLGDQPVGCISAVVYHGAFAFIGFYIVKPEFRGRGFGMALWRSAMERVGDTPAALDGVFDRQNDYAKSGFVFAHRHLRMRFAAGATRILGGEGQPRRFSHDDLDALIQYDRRCFPVGRELFLRKWLTLPGYTCAMVDSPTGIQGYGVVRPCREGFKVGPLFADSARVGAGLLANLCRDIPGDAPVFLDVPESHPEALQLAARLDAVETFGTARMYRGEKPPLDAEAVFGVTTFELG